MWDVTGRVSGTQWTGRVGRDGRGRMVGHMGCDGQGTWESGCNGEAMLYASVVPGIQRSMTALNGPCMHHAWTMGGIKAPQLM